jgi:hypothetical protein
MAFWPSGFLFHVTFNTRIWIEIHLVVLTCTRVKKVVVAVKGLNPATPLAPKLNE